MLNFWRSQGVDAALIEGVEAYRAHYPWTGERVVVAPRYHFYGRRTIEQAAAALLAGENLLLSGVKATGKNVLAENLAAAFGRPDWNVSLHINMDASFLIGADSFADGRVVFRPGPVYECAKAGGFGDAAMTAMFIGLVSAYIGSYIGSFVSEKGLFTFRGSWMPLLVAAVSAAVMAVFIWVEEKKKAEWVEGFALAASMLAGMAAAAIAAAL